MRRRCACWAPSAGASRIVAYLFGLGLVGIAIEAILNRRRDAVADAAADGDLSDMPSTVPTILAIIYVVSLYLLWLQSAMRLFWLALVIGVLIGAIRVTQRAVNNLLRPVGSEASREPGPPSITAALVERGARAVLIVAAAAVIAWAWNVDLGAVARGQSGLGPFAGAMISVVLIALLADFGWHVAKTAIDVHIHQSQVIETPRCRGSPPAGSPAYAPADHPQRPVHRPLATQR